MILRLGAGARTGAVTESGGEGVRMHNSSAALRVMFVRTEAMMMNVIRVLIN